MTRTPRRCTSKMRAPFWAAILGFGLLMPTSTAFAAFVNFIEGPLETDPISVTTNLLLTSPIVVTPETAIVAGFHFPSISPSPVFEGTRAAGLFEPGSTTLLSDYVLLTADPIIPGGPDGIEQMLTIQFFSVDTLVSDLPIGFTFGGGVEENGTLQDISGFLGTLPEGLLVGILSRPQEIPEPSTFVLAALGLSSLSLITWRRRKRVLIC
jgi:hypothetical protein